MPASKAAGIPRGIPGARAAAAPYFAIMLVASLCARAMLGESYERIELSILDAATADLGASPLSAAGLDAIVLLLTTALFACLDWSWSRVAVVVSGASAALWVAANLSNAAAAEPSVARLASANLWITAVAGVALTIAARDRAVGRLIIAALLATGVTIATKCVLQHYVEAADTLEAWQERKQELIAAGANLDDPMIVNYERRVQSLARESTGFHYHANITASCLLLAALPALGIFFASITRRRTTTTPAFTSTSAPARSEISLATLVSVIIVGICALGLALTGSKGGIGAAVIAAVLLVILGVFARQIAFRPAAAIALSGIAYIGVIIAGTAYGVAFGTLPIASLAFRWYYWAAALPAWLDAPITGIGRLNFADAFLRYKSPACVEDVRDPHNLWVSLLVETGPIAMLAVATLLVIAGYFAFASLAPTTRNVDPKGDSALEPRRAAPRLPASRIVPLGLIAIVWLAITHALAGGVVAMQSALLAIWLFEVVLVWSFAFIAALNALAELNEPDGFAGPWLRGACIAAVVGMLVHSLVDFALMTPAGLSLFIIAIAAAAASDRPRGAVDGAARWMRIAACIVGGLTLAAGQLFFNVAHPWTVEREVREIRAHAQGPLDSLSRKVLALDRYHDPDPPRRAAELLINAATESSDFQRRLDLLSLAAESFRSSLRLNPRSERTHRRLAMVFDALANAQREHGMNSVADESQRNAVDEWLAAVSCSPTNPRTRVAAGRAMLEVWNQNPTAALAQSIRDELDAARRIDAARPLGDTVRLSDTALREIDEMLARLATRPASDAVPTSTPVSPP